MKAENHLMSQNAALVQSNARRDEMAQKLREMEELVKEGFKNDVYQSETLFACCCNSLARYCS